MKIVKGNKIVNFGFGELLELSRDKNKVVIDLGTGDGRFVYENALKDSKGLYLGVDPGFKQMEEYSKKSNKKDIANVLYVIGSLEILPEELRGIADKVYINLPWGTLLEAVVKPTPEKITKLEFLMKTNCELELKFGYSAETEPTETKRLELPELSEKYVRENVVSAFENAGFSLEGFLESTQSIDGVTQKVEGNSTALNFSLSANFNINTSWNKKLNFGKSRRMFWLRFHRGS